MVEYIYMLCNNIARSRLIGPRIDHVTALSSRRHVLKKARFDVLLKVIDVNNRQFVCDSGFVGVEDYCSAFDTRWRQRVNALTVLASGQTLSRAMLASGKRFAHC